MAKPKKKHHRRLARARKYFHRKRDKRISIIGTAGAVGSLFVGDSAGHKSLGAWAMDFATGKIPMTDIGNKAQYILSDTMAQYTGYSYIDGKWSIPMGTVTLIASSIAASIAGKFGNKYIKNLPFIGKYVKM
jgi:hypothetical protein